MRERDYEFLYYDNECYSPANRSSEICQALIYLNGDPNDFFSTYKRYFRIIIIILAVVMISLLIIAVGMARRYRISAKAAKRVAIATATPTIPFSTTGLYEYYQGFYAANAIPQVKILCSKNEKKYCTSKKINNLMKELFEIKIRPSDDYRAKRGKKKPIPTNARVISIKMTGFEHGNACHEFIPIDGEIDGSQFTYQMYGDNRIQVTNYLEGGVRYVAGFCIYFNSASHWDVEFPTEVIRKAWYSVQKYAGKRQAPLLDVQQTDETIGLLIEKLQLGIVYCPRLNTNVISRVKEGTVTHQEPGGGTEEVKMKKCFECSVREISPPAYTDVDNIDSNPV